LVWDIAAQAYLPVLTALPELELHFLTRDPGRLAFLAQRYRPAALHTVVADALASATFDAAFVHAATAAHVEQGEPGWRTYPGFSILRPGSKRRENPCAPSAT
jgi:predicted dehydrogenase